MAEILCVYRQVAMLRGQVGGGESQGQDSGGGVVSRRCKSAMLYER
jgi:hypothetical protein